MLLQKKAFVVSLSGGGATFSCLRQDVFSVHNTVLKDIYWQQLTKIKPTTWRLIHFHHYSTTFSTLVQIQLIGYSNVFLDLKLSRQWLSRKLPYEVSHGVVWKLCSKVSEKPAKDRNIFVWMSVRIHQSTRCHISEESYLFLFDCSLFADAISNSGNIISYSRMTVNNKLKRVWKKMVGE